MKRIFWDSPMDSGRGEANRGPRWFRGALDALTVGIERREVRWVLDADIRGFFDNLDHEWLLKFVQHRVADPRLIRLIQKWLKAGVSE
jgi:retron-type reverse transcriptase